MNEISVGDLLELLSGFTNLKVLEVSLLSLLFFLVEIEYQRPCCNSSKMCCIAG